MTETRAVQKPSPPLQTAPSPRCTTPGSPTCILPNLNPRWAKKPSAGDEHTCPHCRRLWRVVDRGHGRFWQWTGGEYSRRPR